MLTGGARRSRAAQTPAAQPAPRAAARAMDRPRAALMRRQARR